MYGLFSYYFLYFKSQLSLGILIPDYIVLYLSITIIFNIILIVYGLRSLFTLKFFILFLCNVIIIFLLRNILIYLFPVLIPYLTISWLGTLFMEWFEHFIVPEITKVWPKCWTYLLDEHDDYDSEPSKHHRRNTRKHLRAHFRGYKHGDLAPYLEPRIVNSTVTQMTAYRLRILFPKADPELASWFCVADLVYPKSGTFLAPISAIAFSSYGVTQQSYVSLFYPIDASCDISSITTVTFRVNSEDKVYAYLGELALRNYTPSKRIFIEGPGENLNKKTYDPGNPEHENKVIWFQEYRVLIKLGIPRPHLTESITEIEEIKEGWKNEYKRCNVHKKD